MLNARVIPVLLLKERGLVKTVKFKEPRYVGDPINAVKIFNEKEVDELVVLDITATTEKRPPSFEWLGEIATEAFMPMCYGGGIRSVEDAQRLFSAGYEKVAINTAAVEDPDLIARLADRFGSQSIVASIDAKRSWLGRYQVQTRSGTKAAGSEPAELARTLVSMGAGEILVNSIDRDGTMQGCDLELIRSISSTVSIPVIACGGVGSLDHIKEAVTEGGASAVAAGSFFVFHGKHRAVLISYPTRRELETVLR